MAPPSTRASQMPPCRYAGRPPLASDRLAALPDGTLVYRLKHRWRDGATHLLFEPVELPRRLAALVPAPRTHLVKYHGVLGPCAGRRDRVGPATAMHAGGESSASGVRHTMSCASLEGPPLAAVDGETPGRRSATASGRLPARPRPSAPPAPSASRTARREPHPRRRPTSADAGFGDGIALTAEDSARDLH